MFTGIIENLGVVSLLKKELDNIHITIKSDLASKLKIDQSVSHNGVCLTAVNIDLEEYTVTAINETINKTNFGSLQIGDDINLERAMKLGDRLDGHMVQGHVDQTAVCKNIKEDEGSWIFTFKYDGSLNNMTIEKGSITVNGVSLTIVNSKKDEFSVAIIPYTYNNTNFNTLTIGSVVNLEFDVLGKYVQKLFKINNAKR